MNVTLTKIIPRSPAAWFLLVVVAAAVVVAAGTALLSRNGILPTDTLEAPDAAPPLPSVGLPDAVPEDKILLEVEPDTAREINAERPFSGLEISLARPFASRLTGPDRDRAQVCLAIAGLYEAGGDASDQKAVMQVILNRVRHPAFPSSICAVVFQGADRVTGCQFSFTCDGSMRRWRPNPNAFARANELAATMMQKSVDQRVGLSTHYHTDWVVPYWSSSLDKLAKVKTHIFFVWKGYWGQRRAFSGTPSVIEPFVGQLSTFSSAHSDPEGDANADPQVAVVADLAAGTGQLPTMLLEPEAAPSSSKPRIFVRKTELAQNAPPGRWALDALKQCGTRSECKILGWADAALIPPTMARDALLASPPDFIFVQELKNRIQTPHWNCAKWPRIATSKCLGSAEETARLALGS